MAEFGEEPFHAFAENKREYYRFISSNSDCIDVHKSNGIESIISEHPCTFYNSIVNINLDKAKSSGDAGKALKEHVDRFVQRRVPVLCEIRSSRMKEVVRAGSAAGLVVVQDKTEVWCRDLKSLKDEDVEVPEGYVIEEIKSGDADTITQWGHCVMLSYPFFPPIERNGMMPKDFMANVYQKIPVGEGYPLRQFVCRSKADGMVAACSTLFTVPGSKYAGMYNVCTRKEHQKKGLGKTMSKLILITAKRAGSETCVLQASADGKPLYIKLGFKPSSMRECVVMSKFSQTPETWKYWAMMRGAEIYLGLFGPTKTPAKVIGGVVAGGVLAAVAAVAYRYLR